MVYLREALLVEAEKISNIAIKSKAFWDYSEEFIEECREDLTIDEQYIKDNHVYVLEGQKGIIGFFSFKLGEQDSLDFLYINPKFIGMGLGKIMWNNMIQKAGDLGIINFTIDSDPNAKGFYEKMGAKQIGETASTVFEGRCLPLMKFTIVE